jgi:hypothetical protein
MIHIIALARKPLNVTLRGAVFKITELSHDNGIIVDFVCEPHSEELKILVSANLRKNLDLNRKELDEAAARINKR